MNKRLRLYLVLATLVVISFPLIATTSLLTPPAVGTVSPGGPIQATSWPNLVFAQTSSLNWGGYAVTGAAGSVTSVEGSWIVPTMSCSGGTTYAAFWVGIDGFSDNTVEQTGVLAECSGTTSSYSTWYEFYPSALVYLTVAVTAGNVVSAGVSYSSTTGLFTVTISDVTTGKTFSTSQTDASAERTSAEWIVERPALCIGSSCTLSTLANFGTAQFGADYTSVSGTNYATVSATTGPIGSFSTSQSITMVNSNGAVIAKPLALSSDGTSFIVSYASGISTTSSSTTSSSSSTSRHHQF